MPKVSPSPVKSLWLKSLWVKSLRVISLCVKTVWVKVRGWKVCGWKTCGWKVSGWKVCARRVSGWRVSGEKYMGKKFMGERLWVKSLWVKVYGWKVCGWKIFGDNRGRWDAGFRSPRLRLCQCISLVSFFGNIFHNFWGLYMTEPTYGWKENRFVNKKTWTLQTSSNKHAACKVRRPHNSIGNWTSAIWRTMLGSILGAMLGFVGPSLLQECLKFAWFEPTMFEATRLNKSWR